MIIYIYIKVLFCRYVSSKQTCHITRLQMYIDVPNPTPKESMAGSDSWGMYMVFLTSISLVQCVFSNTWRIYISI